MTFDLVRKMLSDLLELNEDLITLDSRLLDDLGMDELDRVDIAMDIEDEFEVEVDDEALEKFVTVEDVVNFIENH